MICLYCSLALRDILHTFMARYNLFVLKVPLNTKQTDRHHCTVCGAIYFKTAAAGALSSLVHAKSVCGRAYVMYVCVYSCSSEYIMCKSQGVKRTSSGWRSSLGPKNWSIYILATFWFLLPILTVFFTVTTRNEQHTYTE